jgi:radical SAM superfamily enzyme YgiQ (UPF0313 family)
MDFLLIQSPLEKSQRSSAHGEFIPYGIVALNKSLANHGYQGKLFFEDKPVEDFFANTADLSKHPDLIGISASTWSRFRAIEIIKRSRLAFPQSTIVVGGFHFGNCAEDTIENIPEVDVVVRGEGDEGIVELMEFALKKRQIETITGITYRDSEGETVSNGGRRFVKNLSNLDFLDCDFTKEDFAGNILHPDTPIPSMNIFTGRGCPYGCIFCSVSRINNRKYPVKVVVDKIEEYHKKYGVKGVKFQDDSLTLNEKYVIDMCDEIIDRKLDILWWCDSRADIKYDLLEKMYQAGCRYVSVGLETASPRIQKIIGKKISNDAVRDFAKRCNKSGIGCFVFLITGLPDETPEDLRMTVDFAGELSKRHKAVAGRAGFTNILPGTRLEEIARERGILPEDFSWSAPYNNEKNIEYNSFTTVPIYMEHISSDMYKKALQDMLVNYGSGLGAGKFIKEIFENIFLRHDRTWREKFQVGVSILKQKVCTNNP